ncbi:MAG TPA: MFS transporter [Alphaproteobacteria bacterium]|nr:MFS transporter [Alphaproteobacteria bacterium]
MKQKFKTDSALTPFRYPIFRMLWIASVVSSIGTWMHEVGAAWLMTSLTSDPLLVALIQGMSSFSIFLLALPAGAFADIINKRLYLIFLQSYMMIIAGILAVVTFLGAMTPNFLLFLTFCLGAGNALSAPTWLALMSELVPPKHMTSAVTLIGVNINLSRAIGPALGGLIIAAAGPAAVFAINALSFFGIIISLFGWQRATNDSSLPAERLIGAMKASLRYVKGSPALQTLLLKSCAFFVFASGVWALLPLVARTQLQIGPLGYGVLFACLGLGAVIGAFFLPRFRKNLNCDQLIFMGAIGFSITAFIIALTKDFYFACGAMVLGGVSWIAVLATLTTLIQQVVPSWVRARAISVFLAIFFGGMALGSVVWGGIASHLTISISLLISSIGLIIANFLTYAFTSGQKLIFDQTPSGRSPAPVVEDAPRYDEGPVMVTVEYFVNRDQIDDFSCVMKSLRRIRLRDGAFFWNLFQDIEDRKKFIECFMIESWLEHLRQHERISISDHQIIGQAGSFHEGKDPPRVSHFIARDLPKRRRKKY